MCDPAKIDERGCIGAPDWIIEILSISISAKDLNQKFDDVYEEAGVKEYWVVHPQEQTIFIYLLDENGKYRGLRKPFAQKDMPSPTTLPGLIIDLSLVIPEEDFK